jgi:hypothetical protein
VRAQKNIVWKMALATVAIVCIGWPSRADAQARRYRAVRTQVVVAGGYFYDPFWYDPWYGLQSGWGWYPPYRNYNIERESAVRLNVKPNGAEVYVDGYYAGIVDDFDGAFQRLRLPPGEHEIELYFDGYRPVKQKVYLTPDNTFRIKYTMERLAAGEQAEPRPQPVSPPPGPQGVGQPPMQQPPPGYPPIQPPPQRGPVGRRTPPPQQGPEPRGGQPVSGYGTLAVRVQPNDADVSIDGEPWRGPGGQDRLVVEVAEGSHTVEIRKSGYRTYVTQVEVRRGETTPLNVSLRSEQ